MSRMSPTLLSILTWNELVEPDPPMLTLSTVHSRRSLRGAAGGRAGVHGNSMCRYQRCLRAGRRRAVPAVDGEPGRLRAEIDLRNQNTGAVRDMSTT